MTVIDKSINRCPVCDLEKETNNHMFQCVTSFDQHPIKNFQNALNKIHTDPKITTIMIHMIKNDISNKQLKNKYKLDLHITQALIQQESIGNQLITHGKIAKSWINIQKRYQTFHPSSISSDIWSIKLIQSLMQCSIQIWKSRNDFNNKPKRDITSSQAYRNNSTIFQTFFNRYERYQV